MLILYNYDEEIQGTVLVVVLTPYTKLYYNTDGMLLYASIDLSEGTPRINITHYSDPLY